MQNIRHKIMPLNQQLYAFAIAVFLLFGGVTVTHALETVEAAETVETVEIAETAEIVETAKPEDVDEIPIADKLQALKKTAIGLNRDLFILEEDLLFPANTQVTVFLSVDVGTYFELDAVELLIDDELVTSYLYTNRQLEALKKGGLQRLYIGNLKTGQHEITAFFIGKGPKGEDNKRAASLVFEKGTDPKPLELKIRDSSQRYQAEFSIVEWETND